MEQRKHLPTKPLALSVALGTMFWGYSVWGQELSGNSYTVQGAMLDSLYNGQTIYITRADDGARLDSTVISGSEFVFDGSVVEPAYCHVKVGSIRSWSFILEPGNITLDPYDSHQPSGTPMNDALRSIVTKDECYANMVSDSLKIATARTRIKEEFPPIANTPVGYYFLLSQSMDYITLYDVKEMLAYAGPWLKQTKLYYMLNGVVEGVVNTTEGSSYVDILGVGRDGKPDSLSHYVKSDGGYVVVYLCEGDRWLDEDEQALIAGLHDRFGSQGMNLVGICTLMSEGAYLQKLAQTEADCPLLHDKEGLVFVKYAIERFPHFIVISPGGTILHRGEDANELVKKVTELMQTK